MRADPDNCPLINASTNNFYMMRTVFADIAGCNVEDANVIDESVDLCLGYSYSYSLTFIDRTEGGVRITIPPPDSSAHVCSWDVDGNPLAVLFVICVIHDPRDLCRRHGENDDNVRVPLWFRKVSVIRSKDGSHNVYFISNDAVLLRAIRRLRDARGTVEDGPTTNTTGYQCRQEVNPYDALTSLRTRVFTYAAASDERVITIDFRAHGNADKYDGIKVLNSFGQKGLAVVRDLSTYLPRDADSLTGVQLVMNNCSFVSRQPVGQYLQMRRNACRVVHSAAGEPCLTGYTAIFFTESEPTTRTCPVRFDEMLRSVVITLGMACFQNVKQSLDNVFNPSGLMYPPQVRQILDLYRCRGVWFKFAGDERYVPLASRRQIHTLLDLYRACTERMRALDMYRSGQAALRGICNHVSRGVFANDATTVALITDGRVKVKRTYPHDVDVNSGGNSNANTIVLSLSVAASAFTSPMAKRRRRRLLQHTQDEEDDEENGGLPVGGGSDHDKAPSYRVRMWTTTGHYNQCRHTMVIVHGDPISVLRAVDDAVTTTTRDEVEHLAAQLDNPLDLNDPFT